MRRLITYLNSLHLGVILGMIFLAIISVPAPHHHQSARASGIVISYQVLGERQQKAFLLIAGRATRLADWPPQFCRQTVESGYHLASPVIAISVSPVRPAKLQQACALRK